MKILVYGTKDQIQKFIGEYTNLPSFSYMAFKSVNGTDIDLFDMTTEDLSTKVSHKNPQGVIILFDPSNEKFIENTINGLDSKVPYKIVDVTAKEGKEFFKNAVKSLVEIEKAKMETTTNSNEISTPKRMIKIPGLSKTRNHLIQCIVVKMQELLKKINDLKLEIPEVNENNFRLIKKQIAQLKSEQARQLIDFLEFCDTLKVSLEKNTATPVAQILSMTEKLYSATFFKQDAQQFQSFLNQLKSEAIIPYDMTISQTVAIKNSFHHENNVDEFFHKRFAIHAQKHHHAIIAGSTYSNAKLTEKSKEEILDATAIKFVQDPNGVAIGFSMATGDGLGHAFDAEENQSTAVVTAYCCHEFNRQAVEAINQKKSPNLESIFRNVGKTSRQAALFIAKEQRYDSKSAVVGTAVVNHQGKIEAKNINVGDAMVVVLDGKTHQVKAALLAREYYDVIERRTFNPFSLQRLDEPVKIAKKKTLETQTFSCHEGDIVIQMTDGIYSSLKVEEKMSDDNGQPCLETFIVNDDLEAILSPEQWSNAYPSAYELSAKIAKIVFSREMQNRAIFKELVEELKKQNIILLPLDKNYDNNVFKTPLFTWIKQQSPSLQLLINTYLKNAGHDGVRYDEKTPTDLFIRRLNETVNGQQGFGDCATLSVMRVPYLLDEILRAVIHNPEQLEVICKDYQDYLAKNLNDKTAKEAYQRLSSEQYILNSVQPEGIHYQDQSCKLENIYDAKEIDETIKKIQEKISQLQKTPANKNWFGFKN